MQHGPHRRVTQELLIRHRNLPHWQQGGSVYFVTFRSTHHELSPQARRLVVGHIQFDHGKRYDLVLGVVMPDHVHVIIRPREQQPGVWFDLGTIMKGLKGASARSINLMLGTRGAVWQDEWFDRIIRNERELEQKLSYVFENPVKAGLVTEPLDYEFFAFPEAGQECPAH